MTFSIIVPVYNVAPYLRECLDSVLAAARMLEVGSRNEELGMKDGNSAIPNSSFSYPPSVEIICVDDGSTDGSGEILDEYAEKVGSRNYELGMKDGNSAIPHSSFLIPHFKVIHQKNAGVSAARNAALDVATGEWVLFVDADDRISKDHLIKFLAESERSDINVAGATFVFDDGTVNECYFSSSMVGVGEPIGAICERLIKNDADVNFFGYPWNKFIRRNLIEENAIRFPEGISHSEDEIFMFRCVLAAESIRILNYSTYRYVVHQGSLTNSARPQFDKLAELFKELADTTHSSSMRRLLISRVVSQREQQYRYVKCWRSAYEIVREIKSLRAEVKLTGIKGLTITALWWSTFLASSAYRVMSWANRSTCINFRYVG